MMLLEISVRMRDHAHIACARELCSQQTVNNSPIVPILLLYARAGDPTNNIVENGNFVLCGKDP